MHWKEKIKTRPFEMKHNPPVQLAPVMKHFYGDNSIYQALATFHIWDRNSKIRYYLLKNRDNNKYVVKYVLIQGAYRHKTIYTNTNLKKMKQYFKTLAVVLGSPSGIDWYVK